METRRPIAFDEETQRLTERYDIKRQRLHILDTQADMYGERDVPPQIEMERVQLRYELSVMETALNSPARSSIGDELGPAARFTVNLEQGRQTQDAIRLLGKRLDEFIDDSKEWRTMHRQWILIIGIVVIIILVILAVVITYLATKGAL